jgi:hypothetical protein
MIEGLEEKPASGFVALDKLMGGGSEMLTNRPATLESQSGD